MNEQVKKFLEEAKANEQAAIELAAQKKKEERDEFLISLGLTSGTKRNYSDKPGFPYTNLEPETQKYYYDSPIPVEVTDEEFEEIKKYAQYQKKESVDAVQEQPYSNAAERTLSTINTIMLVLTVFGGLIWFFVSVSDSKEAGIIAGLPALAIIFGYVIVWAVVKVYVNISDNLHEINHKLDK